MGPKIPSSTAVWAQSTSASFRCFMYFFYKPTYHPMDTWYWTPNLPTIHDQIDTMVTWCTLNFIFWWYPSMLSDLSWAPRSSRKVRSTCRLGGMASSLKACWTWDVWLHWRTHSKKVVWKWWKTTHINIYIYLEICVYIICTFIIYKNIFNMNVLVCLLNQSVYCVLLVPHPFPHIGGNSSSWWTHDSRDVHSA